MSGTGGDLASTSGGASGGSSADPPVTLAQVKQLILETIQEERASRSSPSGMFCSHLFCISVSLALSRTLRVAPAGALRFGACPPPPYPCWVYRFHLRLNLYPAFQVLYRLLVLPPTFLLSACSLSALKRTAVPGPPARSPLLVPPARPPLLSRTRPPLAPPRTPSA